MNRKNLFLSAIVGMLALLAGAVARADCSRTLDVPVAPLGLSVTVSGSAIGGIYPELLRVMASKEGCELNFSVVPRARQEALFETGRADLLVPATRTPRRDQHGLFVPLINSRAQLIWLASASPLRPPLRTLAALLERRELRVTLVRGYDYGDAYQALIKELARQGRLVLAVDAVSLARTLAAGIADVTIMNPTILLGAIKSEPKLRAMVDTLRYQPIDDLPWGESGIYVSTKDSLPEADRLLLREALERLAKSGAVYRAFQKLFPPASLADSLRGR